MSRELSATSVNDDLEALGMMNDSKRPGCYAIRLERPDDAPAFVRSTWFSAFDADPPDGLISRLSSASKFVYAGAGYQSVYDRLTDHAKEVRRPTIMDAWPPIEVIDVTTFDNPDDREWEYARWNSSIETAVWCDGDYF